MKSKRTFLILLLAFVLVLGGAGLLYSRLGQELSPEQLTVREPQASASTDDPSDAGASEPEKVPAPDFTVYDSDGNEVHLSDFSGKPIVLNFWASWCGPCKMEMPDFHEAYLNRGDEIQFLMINMTDGSRETVDSASQFIAEQEYTFPIFYDIESDAAVTYGVYSLPTTYFIDADGYAIAQAIGAINAETLQRGVDLILP